MATNNPIELLVTLGVDTESSKDNINKYIQQLKSQVDKLDITIKINGDANFARKLSEQLDGLKEDTKELAQALENIGKKKYKEHALKELDEGIISSKKSLKELTNYLTSQNYKYKVEMGVDEKGFDRVKHVVAEVKTEFGEIHTVHIKPEFDKDGKVLQGFKKVGSAIQNLDTYKLEENISKANEQLIRFARQSKLSAEQYALFESKIAKADTNDELEKTVLLMKQLAESNSFDNKFDKTIAKATYELDKLNESMDRFLKKNARNTNMGAINEFRANVENARKLPVNDDSQAGALAQEVKKLKDDFITLTASAADLEKFRKRVVQINADIAKIGDSGLASKKHVQFLYDQIKNVPLGHLDKLEKKALRVENVLSGLTQKKFILNGIETNINNVVSLNAQLERAYNLNKRYADKKQYAGLQNAVAELSKVNINSVTDVDNATKKYKQLSEQIKLFAADATQQSRNSMTLVNQLKVAFERFPIWMIASTAFYSAVRSTKAFIDVLVDLDSKLVSIEKVAGSGDIATIFDSATESAERFGQSISAVLDAYIEFSRQGYKGADLVNLSSAGLVTANVGEISSQQASEYLTSALIQWNKETSEAMGIIDSWNEIANNYATTVEKLAQGHARSAATARSMGITFSQLNGIIGSVTAATKQSGDEVGNFVKNVLPRLVGEPAQNAMASIGVSLTDKNGNLRDIVEVYTEIANKIQNISDTERIAVVEGLAGKYHISRMNALLADLASADSLYRSMYESSTNSAGSALRENEIYMQSLQARINLVKVEFEKLAVAIGEAFLTDAMIDFMKGASSLLQIFTWIASHVGVVNTVMGGLGTTAILVSRRFRDFGEALGDWVKEKVKATKASEDLEKATKASGKAADVASASVGKLTKAWKTFLLSLGAGAVFFVVGTALEWLIGKFGEARKKSEELESANVELITSYKNSASEIDSLVNKYATLSAEMDNSPNPNTDQWKEYYDLQNQIGELMPSLVIGETELGKKLVGSSDALRIKVALLKEQLEIEQETARLKNAEARDEKIDTYKGAIDDAKGEIEKVYSQFEFLNSDISTPQEFLISFRDENGNPIYDTPEKLLDLMDDLKAKVNAVSESNPEVALYYQNIIDNIGNFLNSNGELFNNSDNSIRKHTSLLKSEYIPIIEEVIEANNGLTESSKATAASVSAQMINFGNLDNLDELKNSLSLLASQSDSWQVYDKIEEIFGKLYSADAENFPKVLDETGASILALGGDLEKLGMHGEEKETILTALQARMTYLAIEQDKYSDSMKLTGKTLAETLPNLILYGNGMEDLDEGVTGLIASFKVFESEAENLAKISEKQIGTTDNLLAQYEMLTSQLVGYSEQQLNDIRRKKDLTLSEQALLDVLLDRDKVLDSLLQIYPDMIESDGQLIASMEEKIAVIHNENEANRLLLEATQLWLDGKLDADEKATVSTAISSKERINYYKGEIAALGVLLLAIMELHNQNEDFVTRQAKANLEHQIRTYQNEIDKLMPDYTSSLAGTRALVDANKNASKSTKENTYVTDKYKQSLEEINLQIEKQLALQKQFPEHSKEYRESLRKQVELEKQKLALQQKQSKELASQIASGNVIDSNTTSTTTKTSQKLNGWSGSINSSYGYRFHPIDKVNKMHYGIDIGGNKGARLDSNVSGKVIAQNYTALSGNYVQIEDSNGYKHFYGHLDEAFVKLGDMVEAGMQIGTIGETGKATGPHLHYEVKDANGKNINPSNFVTAARSNTVYTTTSSGNSQKAYDDLKSQKIDVDMDIIETQGRIYDLEVTKTIDSYIAKFENQKNKLDQLLDNSEVRMKKSDETSESYRNELNAQIKLLQQKKSVNLQEISYLKDLVKQGGISAVTIDDLNNELHELDQENSDIDFAINDLLIDQLNSALGYYEKLRKVQDDVIDSENLRLKELDSNSKLYGATLDKIIAAMEKKRLVNSQELIDLKKMIDSGKFQGEVLEQMTERYKELTKVMRENTLARQEVEYDAVRNVKAQHEEKIDDIQYQIDRLDAIKGSFEEGSADYSNIVKEQIKLQDELTAMYKAEYEALQKEMSVRDLSVDAIKEMSEELENLSIAYWNSIAASKRMSKELSDLEIKLKEDIANKLIDAYKNYLEQRKDAQLRALDAEMDAEEKRHETIMKHYDDELDRFRKNIEAQLELLDEADSQRTYDMDMDELTDERADIVAKMNLLANDDSLRAKAERKELQEKLDEIDKEIAEKRYQRELELRRNELNKKLEEKEEEIEKFIEVEDEKYDSFRDTLDKQRDYWDAYYDNLINDETEFARIREAIMSDNFDAIQGEFNTYIENMKAQMPTFATSMDGAMVTVGESIRTNVIDELNKALELMNSFRTSLIATNTLPDGSGSIIGGGSSNSGSGSSGGSGSGSGSNKDALSAGSMKVLLAKYMAEDLVKVETSEAIKSSIKAKANALAAEGRKEGSPYTSAQTLDSILSTLSKNEKNLLGNYVNSMATSIVQTDYLQEYIKQFAAKLLASSASLDVGGMIPSSLRGIDGKGGRSVIVHPDEIINNPLDSKRLLAMANVLERTMGFISPIISKIPTIPKILGAGGDQYTITFGDVNNATMQQAENFAKEFINNIRVKKGGK